MSNKPEPKLIKGIREHVAETFITALKDMINQYTDLQLNKDVTVFSTFAEPYHNLQETTMLVVDVGSLTISTSTMQPFQGVPYYNAVQYETLSGVVNLHCLSKKEIYSDRLATILLWYLSAKRRDFTSYGFVDAAVVSISEPITVLEEETPSVISYFDQVVTVQFTYASFYQVMPNPDTPWLTIYEIGTQD